MSQVNWDEFKCRCSGISKMMATKKGKEPISEVGLRRIAELEARTKAMTETMKMEYIGLISKRDAPPKVELADGCIEYLMEVYSWKRFGMIPVTKEAMEVAQLEKGKRVEDECTELLSIVDSIEYKKFKERISNDYLSGEIDIYLGNNIFEATNVTDIKAAFDHPSFLKKINNGLANGQREQVAGYCDITGAGEGWVANCLVDNTTEDILDMKWRVAKKMNAITIESPDFLKEWEKWERSMIFSHIPHNQRVYKLPIELFTEFERNAIYDRVKYCREWLWKFDERYQSMNITVALPEISEIIESTEGNS